MIMYKSQRKESGVGFIETMERYAILFEKSGEREREKACTII